MGVSLAGQTTGGQWFRFGGDGPVFLGLQPDNWGAGPNVLLWLQRLRVLGKPTTGLDELWDFHQYREFPAEDSAMLPRHFDHS